MYKNALIVLIVLCLSNSVFSQNPNTEGDCYDPPIFKFDGLDASWSLLIEDSVTLIIPKCLSILDRKYYGSIFASPKIIDESIYFLYRNFRGGTILLKHDMESGQQLWRRDFTPYLDAENYGYGYRDILKTGKNEITLYGVKSFFPNPLFTPDGGRYHRRKLNLTTGEEYDSIPNSTKSAFVSSKVSLKYHKLSDQNIVSYIKCFQPTKLDYSYLCVPQYINEDTYQFVQPSFAADTFYFDKVKSKDDKMFRPYLLGPFKTENKEYCYIYKGFVGDVMHSILIRMDKFGNIVYEKDITSDLLPKDTDYFVWTDYHQIKNGVRIYPISRLEGSYFNIGYIDLDFNGNIIRKQLDIVIDGKHAGHLRTINLLDSDDLLHCIRFKESNDIYFYRENMIGEFTEIAKMENNYNPDTFAFLPKEMVQSKDGDIFMNFKCVLDSLTEYGRFAYGGWDYICKINAEDLNLPTSSKDIISAPKIHLYPNPTRNIVQITQETPQATLNIIDQFGRLIKTIENIPKSYTLSTNDMPPGMYYLQIVDRKKLIKGMEKLVVIR